MSYKISLGLEAAKVPDFMTLWLEKDLPVDIVAKQGTHKGKRIIEVIITGTGLYDIDRKEKAFNKVMCSTGFLEIMEIESIQIKN